MQKGGGLVSYQYSALHPNDEFNKLLARQIAEGRLLKNPITIPADTTRGHAISKSVMEHIVENSKSDRAKMGARNWLKMNGVAE